MRTKRLSLLLIFGALLAPRLVAIPIFYGATQTGDFFSIDPITGITTSIATIAGTPSIVGLAVSNNHLYTLDANTGNVLELNTSGAILNTINIGVGAAAVGEGDIAFNGAGPNFNGSGTMYIASAAFPTVKFYSATLTNSTTGTNALLKTCNTNPCAGSGETRIFFDGISFVGATLYGLQQGGAGLYTINTADGFPTLAGATGLPGGNANGALTTRFTDNQLFGALSNNVGATLYMFSVTGTPTLIGAMGRNNVTGLAFVDVGGPTVPEPSTVLLLSGGLALIAWRRARGFRRS
jgi:PEP-CTERM motif